MWVLATENKNFRWILYFQSLAHVWFDKLEDTYYLASTNSFLGLIPAILQEFASFHFTIFGSISSIPNAILLPAFGQQGSGFLAYDQSQYHFLEKQWPDGYYALQSKS